MTTYHKIQSMFKRDMEPGPNKGRIIEGKWTLPEFKYLKNNEWVFTEKVDGTNIRVMFDGEKVRYGGKTNSAQLPVDLVENLHRQFDSKLDLFKEHFPVEDDGLADVCFYGEGYGAGIQKGACYSSIKQFVLFDIKVGEWWLRRDAMLGLATNFGMDVVPEVATGTLQDGINIVKAGFDSRWGNFTAEGIVAKPATELRARNGSRLITKIKHCDFKMDQ